LARKQLNDRTDIKKSKKRWERTTVAQAEEKTRERSKIFTTDSNIEIPRLATPNDSAYEERLGFPGEYPFTRGVYPTMYRSRLWTMRQYAGYGSAEESNARYRYLIARGTTGLSVAFDLPTQMGYDSDHSMAAGEVGKVGVAIDSLEDMERLFDGIPLQNVSTSMTINATAAILLCLYVAVARKQGADLSRISGTIQNDILKEYAARGTYIYPPEPSMRLVTDLFEWCGHTLPKWNTISISGYHIREAGATAVQEVAFTLANGIAYVEAALKRGMDVDAFGKQLSFFFNAHNNFFEEVAKFRAARRMWARIMRDRFGAKDPETMKLRFHAQTGGATLTAQQIENNVVRVSLQAMAAVLGGCQSLHTNSRDEALALPSEESVQIALRTQQIIAHESGVADTADPLGGSYYVEHLTDELEVRATEYLDQIDAMGGAISAIKKHFFQKEIAASAYAYQKAIEENGKIIVGVNKYQMDEEQTAELLHIDERMQVAQVGRLEALRKRRDDGQTRSRITSLAHAASGTDNLLPHILDCVEHFATVGEISDALRSVWGEYGE
jgi:methylmalonyl-CoA mutase N-terminal domain/subunit